MQGALRNLSNLRPVSGALFTAVFFILLLLGLGLRTVDDAIVNLGYVGFERAAIALNLKPQFAAQYEPAPPASNPIMSMVEETFRLALRFDSSNRQAAFGLSRALMVQGRFQEARDTLQAIEVTNDTDFDNLWIGNLDAWNGNRARALERWLATSDSPLYRSKLAVMLFGQSNWDNYHPERWDDAIYVVETTLAQPNLKPAERVMLELQRADMYQHIGKIARSITAIKEVLTLDPHNAQGRGMLAWLYMNSNRDEEALAQANQALQYSPNWRADYVRGSIFLKRCQLDDAASAFTAGLSGKPDEYRFYWQYIGLGDTYWEQNKAEAAFAQWNLYLEFQPNDSQLRAKLDKALRNELPRNCRGS